MTSAINNPNLSSIEKFLLILAPYEKFMLDTSDKIIQVHELLFDSYTFHAYCIYCDRVSVFKSTYNDYLNSDYWKSATNAHTFVTSTCTMNNLHKYVSYFMINASIFQKIGQFPSVANFINPQLRKYSKILGKKQYGEFQRGIGLFAHGIGIGSFVYLRRIFENLIKTAFDEYSMKIEDKNKSDETEVFKSKRMEEKIIFLKDYLPKLLVENRNIYKILSLGIHELTEEECLKYFEPVRIGIEQILDEKIVIYERNKKNQEVTQMLSGVLEELNSKTK